MAQIMPKKNYGLGLAVVIKAVISVMLLGKLHLSPIYYSLIVLTALKLSKRFI
jgi:hypothetical protein